ncbi:methyltransferase domain-containing protein, partial [Candidatus Desantisbacteria bacterium]|nr:methyltransferase domain-containing protein [Candidatus Desantisbacteria bacterium]
MTYDNLISIENLFQAWNEFVKGKRKKKDVQEFHLNLEDNLFELHRKLKSKTYKHGDYKDFYINDPKSRHIHKAKVTDRIVHHLLYKYLYSVFDKTFIYDSYSCRLNKGTHRGVKRLENFARKVSKNYTGECWALKTPLLSAGGTLGGCIEDLVSGVRSIESLNHIYNDGNVYKAIQEEGYKRYDEEYSTEAVGERCYKVFQGIIDNNLKDVWESLRFKGYENEIACAANMSKEDFYRRRECDVEFAGQSPKALLDEWQNKLNAKVVQENALIMGDKILDLGCGSGALSAVIAKNGAHVTGVDIQDKAKDYFNRIKELLPDDIKERMSFCQTCFPKLDIPDFSHTGAYLLDILEHLIQDDAYNLLKELNRVLDINGHIIICVPNGDEFDIYNGLNGNKPIHITSYTMKSLSDLVVKAGFRIKNAFYDRRADDDNKWNHNRIYILAQKDNRIAQQCGNPGTAVPGRKLKIAIQLPVVNTFGRAVWGDEVMAVGMAQALTRLSEVEKVEIHDPVTIHDNFDIIINYYLHPQTRFVSGPFNIWWYQAPIFSQYTLENMPAILSLYDGFMCASPDLAKFLKKFNRESMIFTMSSNEEYYHRVPSSDNFKADIVFCANNNRSLEDIKNYLIPLVPLGLKIYGSGWEKVPELKDAIKGPIHPKDVPALYSSAKLILSVHTKWHRENNVPTSRLWEASACRAPVISDKLPLAYELFGDSLIWTSGREDIVEKVKYYLQNEKELKEKAEKAYKITIEHGSFDKQVPKILELYHNNFSSARINPVVEKKKGVTNLDVEQVLNKRGQHLNEFMLVNSYDMKINDCFINEEIDKWIADYYAGNTESIFNLLKNNPLYLKYIMKERNIKLISSYVKIVQEEAEILKTKESINPGILNITNDAGETSILLSPFFKISNVSVPGIIQKFVEFNIKKISNDIEILNEFPAGRKYNIINAINVFEFLENPWEAIFKIYNLLEDGGILITNGLWFDPLEQISNEISCIYQHNDNFIMVMDVLGFFLEKNYSSDNFQIGIFSKGRSKGYASALKLIKEFSESENGHCAREKYRTNFITQAKHSIEQKK